AIAGYEQLGQAWNQRRPTYKKALGIYNTLRACEPNDTTYLVQAGRLYAFTGSRAKGRKLVEEALEIDPYSFDAEMMYGIFLFWDRKFEEALEIFRRYPHQPYAILHVAKVQQAQDELEAAEQTLREAIADFPKNKELRFLLAQILRSQLRYYAAQKYLDELVIEDPDDERFWNDSFYNKDHVSPTILGRGSLTYSKEGDPDLDKIIVVSTKYKSSSLKYILPVQDRLTLHATGFYYTEKENNEVRKGIVNYNVYAQGGAFGVDLIATKEIDLKGSCRFKTAGQIGQTVFPFTASGSHVTHIEPAFRFSYTPGYFSFSGSYFYDSFFIKNFSIDRAQLLGKHTIDGAMKIKIPHFERFNVSTDFDLAWYFDNLKNRRVGRSVRVQIPVPFTENTSAIYEYTYGSFAKISPNYNSYKRRQTNSIEILFKKLYNYQTEYGFSWERKWKVSLDESVPVGLIDIELAGNKTRSDRFQGYINYRFQDHLKAQFEMSYLNNNFPYISKSFKGSLEWRF
ncbi:MAG: tetratricopeptide repeat protein, partial [Simkaniaceae bacterium]|nr:tetratricopeptide repeat protein [Simkaniaceae bacterium]